jgi:ArsR family transcriptional regulator, arsenate/arsenite/antimonite-responsive transcriptional repressor
MKSDQACCNELSQWLSPRLFKALADPTRVALLVRIAESRSEQTVTETARGFSIDLSVVSRHLAILRDAGILEAGKRGKEVFYRVRIQALSEALRGLADALDSCCPPETTDGDDRREPANQEAKA